MNAQSGPKRHHYTADALSTVCQWAMAARCGLLPDLDREERKLWDLFFYYQWKRVPYVHGPCLRLYRVFVNGWIFGYTQEQKKRVSENWILSCGLYHKTSHMFIFYNNFIYKNQ